MGFYCLSHASSKNKLSSSDFLKEVPPSEVINRHSVESVDASSVVSRAAGFLELHRSLTIKELGKLTSGGSEMTFLTKVEMFASGRSSLTGICALT